MKKSLHVIISGIVTGVGFRNFVCVNALKLRIKGWVKNTPDQKVEAVFSGKEENVEKMVKLCRRGPSGSQVVRVEKKTPVFQKYISFEIYFDNSNL